MAYQESRHHWSWCGVSCCSILPNLRILICFSFSGLIAYRELTQAGYDVHIYERDNQPGGNWHYTDEVNVDAPIPARDISVGDYIPSLPPKDTKFPYVEVYADDKNDERKRAHRSPKPIWKSLTSNAPAVRIRLFP